EVAAVQGIESFGAVMDVMRHIYAEGASEYDTLVFDTLDALEPHLTEHVCVKNHWDSIEKPPFGRGWIAADDEWRRFIRAAQGIRDKHRKTIGHLEKFLSPSRHESDSVTVRGHGRIGSERVMGQK